MIHCNVCQCTVVGSWYIHMFPKHDLVNNNFHVHKDSNSLYKGSIEEINTSKITFSRISIIVIAWDRVQYLYWDIFPEFWCFCLFIFRAFRRVKVVSFHYERFHNERYVHAVIGNDGNGIIGDLSTRILTRNRLILTLFCNLFGFFS